MSVSKKNEAKYQVVTEACTAVEDARAFLSQFTDRVEAGDYTKTATKKYKLLLNRIEAIDTELFELQGDFEAEEEKLKA